MTVEELFNNYKSHTALSEGHYDYLVDVEDFKKALIEFAKYHVEQALKSVTETVDFLIETDGDPDFNLILNAYPLDLIK